MYIHVNVRPCICTAHVTHTPVPHIINVFLHLFREADISTLQSTEADLFDGHDVCRLLVQGLVDLDQECPGYVMCKAWSVIGPEKREFHRNIIGILWN